MNRLLISSGFKIPTWTSAASPGPAPSRSEAFLLSSFPPPKNNQSSRYSIPSFQFNTSEPRRLLRSTLFKRSLASCVRYGGRPSLHFRILSMVFFRFSPVNGGYGEDGTRITRQKKNKNRTNSTLMRWKQSQNEKTHRSCQHVVHQSPQTPPVHGSVMPAPHQDLRSPGRGGWGGDFNDNIYLIYFISSNKRDSLCAIFVTYMYSMVPQKVWVTVPSWMDSLHRPKSVNFTCPTRRGKGNNRHWWTDR